MYVAEHLQTAQSYREGVQDANEFAWQMQLRYSWNEAVDDAVVRQVNARSAAYTCYPASKCADPVVACYSALEAASCDLLQFADVRCI